MTVSATADADSIYLTYTGTGPFKIERRIATTACAVTLSVSDASHTHDAYTVPINQGDDHTFGFPRTAIWWPRRV